MLSDIWPATRGGSWDDYVNLGRQNIRQFIQRQCAFMGYDRVRAGTQPSYKEILMFRARKLGQAVNSSPNANESPRFHIAGESFPGESTLAGLMGGEVTSLTFGRFIKLLIIWTLVHICNTFAIY